jgi:hypothetical protein
MGIRPGCLGFELFMTTEKKLLRVALPGAPRFMIASSLSSRPERGNSITNGNRLHRASLEIASVSLATKVGLEGKRRVSMSRDSVDMDRRKADDKSSSNDELSLGKLPDQSEIIKASSVMKLCQEEWQPRCIYLTGKLDLLDKLRTNINI